jgi:hypothetical protein
MLVPSSLPSRIGPVEPGMLGGVVVARCSENFVPILKRAGAMWEPSSRRWLVERRRIGPLIRALERAPALYRGAAAKVYRPTVP